MADLQLCYFCGSGPDSSLGEYSIVPPDLDPSPDQQQSVVLCTDCREKLTTVMQPVVEAAQETAGSGRQQSGDQPTDGDAGDEPTGDGPPESDRTGEPSDAAAGERSGEPSDAARGDRSEESADLAGGSGPSSSGDEPVPPEGNGQPGAGDLGSPPDAESSSGGDAGSPSPSGSDDLGAAESSSARSGVGTDDDSGGLPPDSNAKRDQPHADDELVGRDNEAYNKTLRLLQNREFPVERHEIEQVAANAYQLDPQEVSDAIDALINKGLVSQEGAQLVRT